MIPAPIAVIILTVSLAPFVLGVALILLEAHHHDQIRKRSANRLGG